MRFSQQQILAHSRLNQAARFKALCSCKEQLTAGSGTSNRLSKSHMAPAIRTASAAFCSLRLVL
jgi:hypothetical protein